MHISKHKAILIGTLRSIHCACELSLKVKVLITGLWTTFVWHYGLWTTFVWHYTWFQFSAGVPLILVLKQLMRCVWGGGGEKPSTWWWSKSIRSGHKQNILEPRQTLHNPAHNTHIYLVTYLTPTHKIRSASALACYQRRLPTEILFVCFHLLQIWLLAWKIPPPLNKKKQKKVKKFK